MNRGMLAVSIAFAVAAIAVSLYVAGHPFIPEDAVVERDIQATQWGPLALTFPFFTWIGDAKGLVIEVACKRDEDRRDAGVQQFVDGIVSGGRDGQVKGRV